MSTNENTDTPRTDKEWDWANADGGERFKAVEADFARQLERELGDSRKYADKLAAGLPDGMLPADVENVKRANLALAMDCAELRKHLKAVLDWAPSPPDHWRDRDKSEFMADVMNARTYLDT